MHRRPVSKRSSAKKFRKQVSKTKAVNLKKPGRAGIRL